MFFFLSCNNSFDIHLTFLSFFWTYCGIYFSHTLFFNFFLLKIMFCIYLSPAPWISLYYFYNNILLYLVSHVCFVGNRLNQYSHSFFIYNKKNLYKTIMSVLFINQIRTICYVNCIIFTDIPKTNSVGISFNINNSNIIKSHSFLH